MSEEDQMHRFPGMDPYLENSPLWHGFHNGLIAELQRSFNRARPRGYVAVIEQRLSILPDDQVRYGDLVVTKTPKQSVGGGRNSSAVLERGTPDGIVSATSDKSYDWYIEIRTGLPDKNRVVTVIEVLSPSNKAPGSEGFRDYKRKQTELANSDTHLLEIDLLRFGAHTVLAPLANLPDRKNWDYILSLHRVTDRFRCSYWLNRLSNALPIIQIPLLPEDPDVILDFQSIFRAAYEAGLYYELLDYPR